MILLFENYKKAQALIKQNFDKLTSKQLDYIDYIASSVDSGYIGKLVELYIDDAINGSDNILRLEYIIKNINSVKLNKPIDDYNTIFDVYKDISIKKIVTVLNKIKKKLGTKLDMTKVATILFTNGIDINKLDIKIENNSLILNKQPRSEEELAILITNTVIKKHKDWKIIYEDDNYLIYEILTYEGAINLAHKRQCINSQQTWNDYKNRGIRFINIINKLEIEKSICLDIRRLHYNYYSYNIFTWNNKCIDVNISNLLDPDILKELSDTKGLEIYVGLENKI